MSGDNMRDAIVLEPVKNRLVNIRFYCGSLDLDLKTRIKCVSKGTLAKTAWICATAHRPKVLILDEPTSGLDAIVRDALHSYKRRHLLCSR